MSRSFTKQKEGWMARRRGRLVGAAWATLVGWCLLILPLGGPLVRLSYDFSYLLRPTVHPTEAIILYMDPESHERLHQPWFRPWNRAVHAQLVENLKAFGTKAVVFDILFDEPGENPMADAKLIAAAKFHGKVVFGAGIRTTSVEGHLVSRNINPPFLALRTNAAFGLTATADADDSIRQHRRHSAQFPTLAGRALELVDPTRSPEPQERLWLNYYGPPGTVSYRSYVEAIETNSNSSQLFSNKTVFVGALVDVGFTAGKGTDDYATPYTFWYDTKSPGVEVNATIFLNLLRRDALRQLPWYFDLLFITSLGALAGYGFGGWRPIVATIGLVVGALLVALICSFLVWQTHYWTPWMIVCVAQLPSAWGWSLVLAASRPQVQSAVVPPNEALNPTQTVLLPLDRPATSASSGNSKSQSAAPVVPTPAVQGSLEREMPPIAGHTLIRRIGHGAYGEVWLARDVLGGYHAVKIVYRDRFDSDLPFDREFHGIQKYAPISLSHPCFLPVLHVDRNETAGYFYYIMELGDDQNGGREFHPDTYAPWDLRTELRRRQRLPVVECAQLGVALADALEHLHREKLVHRDIKPSNVIFVRGKACLADIGLVTEMAQADEEVSLVGTPSYMPPEGPGQAQADIYSLGKLLYVIGMGRQPRDFPELPSAFVAGPEIAALSHLNVIILKACAHEAKERHQSAGELRDDLHQLMESLISTPKKR